MHLRYASYSHALSIFPVAWQGLMLFKTACHCTHLFKIIYLNTYFNFNFTEESLFYLLNCAPLDSPGGYLCLL